MTYTGRMADDPVDRMLTGWDETRPDLDVGALQVTARLSRIGTHLARRQEDAFEPLRARARRGRAAERAPDLGAAAPAVPYPPREGPHALVRGRHQRIDRLERRGFVRRLADPNDRRGVMIELTDEGLEVVDAAVAANVASDRQLLERLDAGELGRSKGSCASCSPSFELPE